MGIGVGDEFMLVAGWGVVLSRTHLAGSVCLQAVSGACLCMVAGGL